jgi:peptidoglycan/LPS O-acetylase OafA/YrhL
LPVGIAFVGAALVLFSIRGPLLGTNLFLVFQAQPGTVAGFPLISIGIALILGAMLDLEHVLKRWPVPGAVIVATLSYSRYLTHKSVFHVDRLIFGEENLQAVSASWSIWRPVLRPQPCSGFVSRGLSSYLGIEFSLPSK